MKGIKKWNIDWNYGEKNFLIKNKSNVEIFRKKFSNILEDVQLNTPVASISYRDSKNIIVKDSSGKSYIADFVVVSIPVSQLKKEKIRFEPELPKAKKEALTQITMSPAMKVFLKFKKRFWAEDLGTLITTGVIKMAMDFKLWWEK